ncbi:hypothetical protein [Membranihabitans maritimus]|uniref:hypothetical protein n=1 Tax=Membranihabitans maritimus TaxID=2904244 RepID=UPI001F431969|nr:hypothetical protein [Membranihabitans maritimus]
MEIGLDQYGVEFTDFWMASLDTYHKKYPERLERPAHIPNRVYLDRYIDAPNGSTLYWDIPSVVLMYNLSKFTDNESYKNNAHNYVKSFMENCIAPNGVFLWGNHYYYNAFVDSTVKFGSEPIPINIPTEMGNMHEIRPFVPAWDVFWEIDAKITENEIRQAIQNHLSDKNTGQFNRHAEPGKHAFLEAGGVLVYSLAWLYDKTKDISLLETADKIINYSFSNRNKRTGLIPNSPTSGRWDSFTSTTEVGLWSGCIVNASKWATKEYAEKWINIAEFAVSSWLNFGWDQNVNKYYGMLNISDGSWIQRENDYPYMPDNHSNLWHPLFPRHDYPMSFAETCLSLYILTKKEIFKESCIRWKSIIKSELPARMGMGAYAEHYGRVIWFLLSCAEELEDISFRYLAEEVAEESINVLFAHDMFRGHPGENRYDAVDGVGILSLALLWLDSNQKPDLMGLYF